MADWRQIQARIRKAKTSSNPSAKLSELYQRTRDAMVAWELATLEEKNGRADEAAKWYVAAVQRFRRDEWKKKAEEALARLGVEVPIPSSAANSNEAVPNEAQAVPPAEVADESEASLAAGEIREFSAAPGEILEETSTDTSSPSTARAGGAPRVEGHRKRRRGRRGGRGRRRGGPASPPLPSQAFAASSSSPDVPASKAQADDTIAFPVSSDVEEEPPQSRRETRDTERRSERPEVRGAGREQPEPMLPSERTARGRAGDPALASRMAHLESMLRRLLSSPLHRLDEIDDAPAGPGVFLLSDSDQVTSYYTESCQTLRIGLANLTRGSRGRAHRAGSRNYSEVDLKEKLADHLGINQSKVSQYMKDHCVVRWIQLDDDAPHLAHFAVGVLRTPLNID